MDRKIADETFSEEETANRRDAALLRALSTPHKRQAEMKVGKPKDSVVSDPTILSLRRALDRHAASGETRENAADGLVSVILSCLPLDICNTVFLPADGTHGRHLAIAFEPAFRRYVTFAAEYWVGLAHRFPSLRASDIQCPPLSPNR